MSVSSAEIKRQILISAGNSSIKKRMDANPPGITEGEQIEIGNDLEAVTRLKGWTLIETYMLRRMNLVGLVLDAEAKPDDRGVARAFIELMQWMSLCIKRRDEILEKEKIKYVSQAKAIQKDESE
jgi:hypothetical protein